MFFLHSWSQFFSLDNLSLNWNLRKDWVFNWYTHSFMQHWNPECNVICNITFQGIYFHDLVISDSIVKLLPAYWDKTTFKIRNMDFYASIQIQSKAFIPSESIQPLSVSYSELKREWWPIFKIHNHFWKIFFWK